MLLQYQFSQSVRGFSKLRHGMLSTRTYRTVPYKLSLAQRVFVSAYYAGVAISDPERADAVAGLGDVTGEAASARLVTRMKSTPSGRRLLAKKPLINSQSVDLEALKVLPEGTLGHAYAQYMERHTFDADARNPVRFLQDPDTAYAMVRYRQIHDFWHILCDLPPTLSGELALKWFEWRQTGLPVAGLSALIGPLRLSFGQVRVF
jgi:ubiquinone biosynthesis protein COQ4